MANEATPPNSNGSDLSGQTLGDYYLHRKLGEGGMGQVYLADQLSLRRQVALKLLRTDVACNETSRKRFEAEARAVAQLTHANIVQVYDYDSAGDRVFMALEFVDGRNLREYVERKGPPELPVALSIMKQTSAALQRAAELGIIHRDVKPENILLTRKGEVKVTDFGLSRVVSDAQPAQNLTQTGVTMGTPLYMSPEQVEGRPLDHRTDVYSLGVTFYYLLAGEPPFKGDNAFAVALQHVQAEPPPLATIRPDLPPELCAIVHKMMAKRPEQRYAGAGDVLRDLKRLASQVNGGLTGALALPSISMPSLPALTTGLDIPLGPTLELPRPRSSRWPVVGIFVASLLIAGGSGAVLAYALRPPPPPDDDAGADVARSDANRQLFAAALGSYKQKEQALRTLIDSESPVKEREDVQRGLAHRIDLAVLYLEQQPRELAKANDLFQRQTSSKVPEYANFGKLGEAMVLAFQDDAEASVSRFQELNRAGVRLEIIQPMRYPRFAKLVADALHHNQKNFEPKAKYPAQLKLMQEQLLRGQGPRPGGNPPSKPSGG